MAQLIEQAPVAWQEIEGERVDVAVAFQVLDGQQIQFALGAYHPAYALVLDPTLVYSTFLGGRASDEGEAIAVDQAGQVYVTGYTRSTDFPTSEGAHDRLIHITYGGDIFVVKLNISGDALIYSTFLGGNRSEKAYAIAVDRGGQAYITGRTGSNDFPTTAAAYDTTHAHGSGSYGSDIFITKLNEDGSDLIYSTFLGGSDRSEKARAIAVDTSGQAYITGYTDSNDFPTTAGAYDTTHNGSNDVFITKLNESGSDLVYSTFLGGSANDVANEIALDRTGRVYVTGYTYSDDFPTTAGAYDTTLNGRDDGFVTKLNENGSALVYSTFLGGSAYTSYSSDERAEAMVVDNLGQVYVTGYTRSDDFPTTAGAYDTTHNGHRDVFVTKLNKQGSALVYSTFLGGISSDVAYGIALDRIGQVYVTGYIYSDDFPTTAGAYDTTRDGYSDVFVTQLNEQGSDLVYSTFWGGKSYETGRSIVVDNAERVYLTGSTRSSDFPTTAGAYDETYNGGYLALVDAFITRFDFTSPASLTLTLPNVPQDPTDPTRYPLGLHAETGWYDVNPVQVQVEMSDELRAQLVADDCYRLHIEANNPGSGDPETLVRFYPLTELGHSQMLEHVSSGGGRFVHNWLEARDLVVNAAEFEEKLQLELWLQPSLAGALELQATLYDDCINLNPLAMADNIILDVPTAQIHPVVFLHGILGSMPPGEAMITDWPQQIDGSYTYNQNVPHLDPFSGSYKPLLDNLLKMGYEIDKTLYPTTYDWRKSNINSAAYVAKNGVAACQKASHHRFRLCQKISRRLGESRLHRPQYGRHGATGLSAKYGHRRRT